MRPVRLACVAAIVLLITGCPRGAPSAPDGGFSGDLATALGHAREGFHAQAKAELNGKHTPAALVLRACVHLDAGEWKEAGETLRLLSVEAPGSAEGRLLEAYLRIRRDTPRGAFIDFMNAWNAVGRPSFASGGFLPSERAIGYDVPPSEHKAGNLRSRLLALAHRTDADLEWLVDELPHVEDIPLFLAIRAAVLTEKTPDRLRIRALPVVHERLTTFLGLRPDSLPLRLAVFFTVSRPDVPIDEAELAALTTLVQTNRGRVFGIGDTAARFERALGTTREVWMRGVAFWQTGAALSAPEYGLLSARVEATAARGNVDRRRLGSVLWHAGRLLLEQDTLFETTEGARMLRKAAELAGDPDWSKRAAQETGLARALQGALRELPLGRWPLHTVAMEAYDLQVANERAFIALYFADRREDPAGVPGPP